MMPSMEGHGRRRMVASLAVLLSVAVVLTGCFMDKPEIEDLWTRIDVTASNIIPFQPVTAGALPVTMGVDITYRSILTGFAVAELRASPNVSAAQVFLEPNGNRVRMASDIDYILANSVTMGRATRAVTGWDHLIQHIDFNFTANVPTGSAGLFLVCYMGSGDEIQLPGGIDSLVVTPFNSGTYQILPVGMEVAAP